MNKLDFFITGLWYSTLIIIVCTVILIAAVVLAFIPVWVQFIIALAIGFEIAFEKSKKK